MNTCSSFVCVSVRILDYTKVLWLTLDTDRKTSEPTAYVDIKSEGLRDILRTVLRDVKWISLGEDKPAVYTFVHDLSGFLAANERDRLSETCCTITFVTWKRIESLRLTALCTTLQH